MEKTVDSLYKTYYSAKESYVARDFSRLIAFFLSSRIRPAKIIPAPSSVPVKA